MKRILLVDDDEDILEIVKHLLTAHGFNLQTHTTGHNVPEVVNDYKPNLILLDINLPGKSGVEICKELKKDLSIPIILFSAQTEQQEAVAESNADDFINKPFEADHLINKIGAHLKLVLTVF